MKRTFAQVLISLLFLSGCSAVVLPPIVGVEVPQDRVTLNTQAAAPSFFKVLLSGTTTVNDEKQTLRYAIISQDEMLRIEVFPTTSFYTLLLLKSDGERFSFQNFTDGTSSSGALSEETLSSLFGISLTANELRGVMLGRLPKGPIQYHFFDAGYLWQVIGKPPIGEEIIFYGEIEKTSHRLKKMIFLDKGDVRAEISTESFTSQQTPQRFTIIIPRFDATMSCLVRSIDFTGSSSPDLFSPVP